MQVLSSNNLFIDPKEPTAPGCFVVFRGNRVRLPAKLQDATYLEGEEFDGEHVMRKQRDVSGSIFLEIVRRGDTRKSWKLPATPVALVRELRPEDEGNADLERLSVLHPLSMSFVTYVVVTRFPGVEDLREEPENGQSSS